MKRIIMTAAAAIMAMSLLMGAGSAVTAGAKAKSHRCSVMKGCRVTGTHHSKKHHKKTCRVKTHHSGSHHSGHH